jgi:AraC-like DNA-binding protein
LYQHGLFLLFFIEHPIVKTSPVEPHPTSLRLLFGDSDAAIHTSYKVFGDRMNQASPGVNAYDPIGSPGDFSSKITALKLPAMQLVAVVMTPSYIDRTSTQNATLMVPLAGEFNCLLEGRAHRCGADLGSMYFPQGSGQVKGSGGTRNQVSLQFEPRLLEQTTRAMLGLPGNAEIDMQLENPRVASLAVAGQPFSTVLQHVGALIDLHQRDARVLAQLGLQDMLYRHIAMVLRPELFLPQADIPRSTNSAALVARLCDYMAGHLDAGLTLTDLEVFSGLSARSLQLAFKKELGRTPMQWLTEQKLQAIRVKLAHADASESVTSLAVAYFPNMGDFARYYRRQFGELPSQTLARHDH